PAAMEIMALHYLQNAGEKNPLTPDQLALALRASERTKSRALGYALAEAYRMGVVTEKNNAEAVKWYTSVAEEAGLPAWYHLGQIYSFGGQDIVSKEKARYWLARVVEKEAGIGYYEYAFLLYEINPVKYRDEIVKWAKKAELQRDLRAKGLLLRITGDNAEM